MAASLPRLLGLVVAAPRFFVAALPSPTSPDPSALLGATANATCAPASCCAGLENLCLDDLDRVPVVGVLLELFLLVYAFVAVAIIADEHLVVSLETLCVRWNVREDVAGASFMAFGSAAPEIIINAVSTLKVILAANREDASGGDDSACGCDDSCQGDDAALGVGAIIGSGMIAFAFIPGCCGLAVSRPLELKRRPLARDIIAYLAALALLHGAIADGQIEPAESGVMVGTYLTYLLLVIFAASVRERYRVKHLGRAPRSKSSFVTQAQESLNPAAQAGGDAPAFLSATSTAVPIVTTVVSPLQFDSMSAPVFRSPSSSAVPADEGGPPRATGIAMADGPFPINPLPLVPPVADVPTEPSPPPPQPTTPPGADEGGDEAAGASALSARWAALAATRPRLARACELAAAGGRASLAPLQAALRVTCPECSHDAPTARLYPITLVSAFVWVSLFSTLIAAVVTRWGTMLCIPAAYLGMYVIAVGAEIPDTIQSVTVAKRGYGSMAVSNSTGSQIINILIGLGLPWLLTNLSGRTVPIPMPSVSTLHLMADLQGGNVLVYTSLLLLPTIRSWRPGDHSKASLGPQKGKVLLGAYLSLLVLFPVCRALFL